VQGALELLGIADTGSGVMASSMAMDKVMTKRLWRSHGLATPESVCLSPAEQTPARIAAIPASLGLPLIVKPPREGSSVGVTIVKDPAQALAAMENAAQYGSEILVEAFVEGMELTVAILDDVAMPIVHIIPPEGVYDMASKYPWLSGAKGSQYICPADLDAETTRRVQEAALAGHRSLGVEIYSRVDVLLDAAGNPFVLEANTIPGMTETSLLPKSAAAHGIGFTELCLKIAELSLALRS